MFPFHEHDLLCSHLMNMFYRIRISQTWFEVFPSHKRNRWLPACTSAHTWLWTMLVFLHTLVCELCLYFYAHLIVIYACVSAHTGLWIMNVFMRTLDCDLCMYLWAHTWLCIMHVFLNCYDSALLQTDQLTILAHSEVVWGPVWLTKLALSEVNWEPVWIDFICCTCCHYQGNMALCGAGSSHCHVIMSRRHTHWLTSWTSSYD